MYLHCNTGGKQSQTKEKLPTSGSEEDVTEQRNPTGQALIASLDATYLILYSVSFMSSGISIFTSIIKIPSFISAFSTFTI